MHDLGFGWEILEIMWIHSEWIHCKLWQVLSINIVNIKLSHFIIGFFFHFTVIFSYTEQIRLLLHTFTDWHADSFESFIIKFICLRPTIKFCCCLFISVTDVQLHLVVEYHTELASISVEKNIRYFSNTNLLLHRLLKTSNYSVSSWRISVKYIFKISTLFCGPVSHWIHLHELLLTGELDNEHVPIRNNSNSSPQQRTLKSPERKNNLLSQPNSCSRQGNTVMLSTT